MGKKAKKRWRTVPIELCSFKPVGRKDNNETEPIKDKFTPPPPAPKFNEDEYTKISTPRQDVLFKKGYLGRRRVQNVGPETPVQEHHSQDSMKSDYYVNDSIDPAHMILPPPAYIDPVYFLNGSGYEVYDPYTGSVTVVVGPPAPPFPPGGHPYLTPIPYQHVPMQPPLEWFSPQAPPQQWAQPSSYNYRKRFSFDSQNCSAQSSESTGPPSSPQETELIDDSGMASQYQYSGYMYPPYHINDVTGQTQFVDAACHPETSFKRRKQLRKRRRREGIADGGSESSCEDHCYQSGASVELTNDSKTASDSGVNTHNSGGSTPVNSLPPYPSSELVSGFDKLGSPSPHPDDPETPAPAPETQAPSPPPAPPSADVCATHPHVPVEDVTSSISTAQSVDTPPSGGATSEGATLAVLDAVNDNKENCDVNICSKQEASSVSCNSKILSKANLSVVESNSIRACESAPPADDQTSNPKAEKGSNKQSKAKSAQAPSPKNSKKSKSKSKSKTQQAPGSKQSKNNHSEEPEVENASAETNERTSTPTSKTSKKLKKGQERKSKESITPEKQVVDVNKESESKQDKEKSPRPDCELNGKDTDVKSEVEGTGAEKNVIEAISEFHPSESQCCLSEVSVVDNAEPKTEIELCVDVAGSEDEVSPSEKAPDVPDSRVEVGGCEEGAMEPKAPNAAPTDEQRFLATFVNLEEIGETVDGEEVGISRFSSCRDVEPKRPPRRKKSEKRLAENVASQVLDEVLAEAAEKVSEVQNTPPGKITEAVSKWLTENGGVLPPLPQSQDDDWEEEDEELEEESIATDQKNSESNPFPASLPERDGSPEGGGKRVATPKIGAESDDETVTTIDEKSKLLELGDDSGCSLRNRSGEKPPGEAAPDQTDTSNHENKTDLKVHHSSSFPCGICCNIL